jgi:uncharacterized membrane protein YfcA
VSAIAIAAGIAVLAGAALQSATGFGFALVSAPLLFAAVEPEQAVALLLALGLVVNLLTLATEGRRPQPLVADTVRMLVWALPGVVVGVIALRSLDSTALQVGVTVGVFATLAARHVANRRKPDAPSDTPAWWAAPAAGFSSGALTTSTNTAGPPIVLYLLSRDATPVQTRDTLTASFLGLTALGAAALAAGGSSAAAPKATALAALVPLAIAGHLAGRPIFARLEQERYEPVLTAVLVAAALGGLLTALL